MKNTGEIKVLNEKFFFLESCFFRKKQEAFQPAGGYLLGAMRLRRC
jgi:hypothetical protein